MDDQKVGQLIDQLRREKGLTQRQLAERLHISNTTVSKGECGQGCPDLSLWDGLCAQLGADLHKLLQGELSPNRPDVGKLDRTRFYVCPVCGNILISTGRASLSCCGRKLSPLTGAPCTEEHRPSVRESDIDYYVTFPHPMEKDHFIAFAAHVHDNKVLLVRLYPEQGAEVRLPMTGRDGTLYLYCTKHGLQSCPFPDRG